MKNAQISLHRDITLGTVTGDMFGNFEQTTPDGILNYDAKSPHSDEQGFRRDMIEQFKKYGLGLLRFPGGSNMCLYEWKDGIGPKEKRFARTYYTGGLNQVDKMILGIDECFDYCEKLGCRVMLDLRAGFMSGTLTDIYDELEYVFCDNDSYYSRLRKQYGHEKPWKVDYICIGNEEDGDWELCQHTPETYALFAAQVCKLIRYFSPETKIIVCGTSNPAVATYPEWDRILLDRVYELCDYLSIHYIRMCNPNQHAGAAESPLGVEDLAYLSTEFDNFISTSEAVITYIKNKHKAKNRVGISIEEWAFPGIPDSIPEGLGWTEISEFTREDKILMGRDPDQALHMFDRIGRLLDALAYGQAYVTMINHANSVDISTGGFGMTLKFGKDTILLTPSYYVGEQLSHHARGTALKTAVNAEPLITKRFGEAPAIQSCSVYNEETKELAVFVLNMSYTDAYDLHLNIGGFDSLSLSSVTEIQDDQPLAGNTFVIPDRVIPKAAPFEPGQKDFVIRKTSWTMFLFRAE